MAADEVSSPHAQHGGVRDDFVSILPSPSSAPSDAKRLRRAEYELIFGLVHYHFDLVPCGAQTRSLLWYVVICETMATADTVCTQVWLVHFRILVQPWGQSSLLGNQV
jgi:hypothetical protein